METITKLDITTIKLECCAHVSIKEKEVSLIHNLEIHCFDGGSVSDDSFFIKFEDDKGNCKTAEIERTTLINALNFLNLQANLLIEKERKISILRKINEETSF